MEFNKFFVFNNVRKEVRKIKREEKAIKQKIKSVNVDTAEVTLLGKSGNREVYAKDNGKHFLICGTTGSGKTVTLANFIRTAFEKDYPGVIVDGKGDISQGSILNIIEDLNAEYGMMKPVYIIDMNNPENSDYYNPFKGTSATVIKDMLINMSDWTEEHYKVNTERYLQLVISMMIKAKVDITFKRIIDYMPVADFTKFSAELFKKEIITKDDHIQNVKIAESSGKIASDSIARFSLIAESDVGQIFCGNGIDIYTALKHNAIIVIVLDPLSYPELSPKIGRLALIDCKKAVSKLYRERIERTFFMFDEINVYASTTLLDLLNKSRSANVTCFCALQSLSDLDFAVSEDFKWQVIENTNNYIVQRQNSSVNAENWANVLGTRSTVELTHQLDQSGRNTHSTGMASARHVREYLYHPDIIKTLETGEAIYMSKDTGSHAKIKVRKPF